MGTDVVAVVLLSTSISLTHREEPETANSSKSEHDSVAKCEEEEK